MPYNQLTALTPLRMCVIGGQIWCCAPFAHKWRAQEPVSPRKNDLMAFICI